MKVKLQMVIEFASYVAVLRPDLWAWGPALKTGGPPNNFKALAQQLAEAARTSAPSDATAVTGESARAWARVAKRGTSPEPGARVGEMTQASLPPFLARGT